MLFSIIIPVYKIEKYLDVCVNSILKQTMTDFEIILIDDGSPDRCPEICERLKKQDTRIKVIHKANEGVSAARSDGAKYAKGEYIICVDGDDWIDSQCLQIIADAIYKTKAEIVCHGMMYDNGNEWVSKKLTYNEGFYSRNRMEKEIFPTLIQSEKASCFSPSLCGKAIKRQLFLENLMVDRRVSIGEDGACVIPCVFHADSICILKECLYYYRYNGASATKSRRVYNWDWPKLVAEHIATKIDLQYGDFQEQLDRKIVHDVFTVVVSQFNRNTVYREIVKDIQEHLKDKVYYNAIEKCRFKGSMKAILMEAALKNQLYWLICLYSKKGR